MDALLMDFTAWTGLSTTFLIGWLIIMALDGALLSGLDWYVTTEQGAKYRIRTPKKYAIPKWKRRINISLNNLMSLLFLVAGLFWFAPVLMYQGMPDSVALLFGETLATLLLYDFLYYFYHRGMHHPKILKYVHRIHHYVKFPTAPESTYLHPLEALGALSLLLFSVWVFGPISEISFLLMFAVYSTVNILVHSNLVIPHPAFRLLNFWAIRHDHHHAHLKYNYASIFPFWDQAFGTYK